MAENREGYYEYMLRRTREENKEPNFTDNLGEGISSSGSILKREIKELNKQYYSSLIRIKELNEELRELKDKVEALENANLHSN
tara:strand:+ start:344 stop:595 length:252 start_codon:yes stop_codon:yes gene_type:complete